MSLFKQITVSISLFLLIILVSIMFLNFQSSQKFIQDQLYSSAEDTAASLALALTGVLHREKSESEILSEMDTMIAAIYDRGYYQRISLYNDDKVLIVKHSDIVVKSVPKWFVKHVALEAKAAHSEVSGGWNTFGIVEVSSHVGHAYVQLWNIFINLLKTFLLMAFGFLLLLGLMLKIILRSLKAVEYQAKAIENHDFYLTEKVPFTTEFKHVVRAMNHMVSKVKVIFDKEAESLKKYHELLYTDTQTKLYNRRYLSMMLNNCFEADSLNAQGSFVLFSFEDLEKAKTTLGYVALESLLVLLADMIEAIAVSYDNAVAARMNESDFALLLPQVSFEDVEDELITMLKHMQKLFEDSGVLPDLHVSAGAISYTPDDTIKSLFSRADFELAKAKIKEANIIEFGKNNVQEGIVLGKHEWIKMFNTSVEEHMLKVASQKVISVDDESILHEELYIRMIDHGGTIHNAGYFMPVLANLKLTDNVDKHVVNLALHHSNKALLSSSVAINISSDFLKSPKNLEWIEEKVNAFIKISPFKLHFEASRFAVIQNSELFTIFSQMLKSYGCSFGIDNFSIDSSGLDYLKVIKPAYIKANCSFFFDLNEDENSSSASDSLSIVSNSLGIILIATAVEEKANIKKLKKIGVNYVQGSAIDIPEILGV